MDFKEQLKSFCKSIGLDCCGIAPSPTGTGCAVVCLFPYYQPIEMQRNLSRYAVMPDYHMVVCSYLLRISAFLQEQTGIDYSGQIYCDNSPYQDRSLAVAAGLGFIGQNTCLIHPVYGSYVFIGYIVCKSLNLSPDKPLSCSCIGCGKCRTACHGGALLENGIQIDRCASHITQKKGDLSKTEQSILMKNPLIWGCDTCQEVCPHNHSIPTTPILEFRQSLVPFLTKEELLLLSGREFRRRYRQRAFSWRGKDVLLRNFTLKDQNGI